MEEARDSAGRLLRFCTASFLDFVENRLHKILRRAVYSITKMNSLLEDVHINYKVDSHSAYWIVQEHDWETEEE